MAKVWFEDITRKGSIHVVMLSTPRPKSQYIFYENILLKQTFKEDIHCRNVTLCSLSKIRNVKKMDDVHQVETLAAFRFVRIVI